MPEPRCRAWTLAGWPCVLGLGMLGFVDGWFDRLLCLSLLAQPLALRTLPPERRRRVLTVELPVVVIGGIVVAWLLAGRKAMRLGADMPWAEGIRLGLYVAVWILVLRLLYQLLDAAMRRLLRRRLAGRIIAGVALIVLGMPQLFVALQTHRIAISQPMSFGAELADVREVAFATRDGLTLRGTLLTRPEWSASHPVFVVCHGVGASRANVSPYVTMAFELGCHVLVYDARGHGNSDGTFTTLGDREADDIVDAVRWLRGDRFAGHPVVLLGVSMGGASVLRAAAEAGAAAVFAESAFADLGTMVGERLALLGPLRAGGCWLVGVAAWLQLGVELDAVSPRQSLATLPDETAVVLVHAGADDVVPIEEGRRLAAARPGLALQRIDGASHGACAYVAPLRTRRLLRELLEQLR